MKQSSRILILVICTTLILCAFFIPLLLFPKDDSSVENSIQNVDVWFEGPMVRLERNAELKNQTTYHLYAARGEYEPFQIIVKPLNRSVTDVHVTISDFHSEEHIISSDNIELFYEYYISVETPSNFGTPYPPREYPDALIPFYNPVTGEDIIDAQYDGYPFDIENNTCQPIWVDVFIPRNAYADSYEAKITVNATDQILGTVSHSFNVSLTVWDFDLPYKPALETAFYLSHGPLWDFYDIEHESDVDAAWRSLHTTYKKEILRHKITPRGISYYMPQPLENGTPNWADGAYYEFENELRFWIEEMNATTVDFYYIPYLDPFLNTSGPDRNRTINYVKGIYDLMKANDWEDLLFIHMYDEPNDADEYQTVRDYADVFQEVDESLRCLVTEQMTPQDPSWGSLIGSVNLWCPIWGSFSETEVQARQEAGEEVWMYGSFLIDYPITTHRKCFWTAEHFGLTGYLHGGLTTWSDVEDYDPWTDTASQLGSHGAVYNKDGDFLYPGLQAGLEELPVVSIRLKIIREGIEDFDYFRILKGLGKEEICNSIVDSISDGWYDQNGWLTNPENLMLERRNLADTIIDALHNDSLNIQLSSSVWNECELSLNGTIIQQPTIISQKQDQMLCNIVFRRNELSSFQTFLWLAKRETAEPADSDYRGYSEV
ncbi:MAG: glycoside hydrolase domain-containing protein [Candidatus Thorarchaeota archaeon]